MRPFERYRPAMVFFYILACGMSAMFGLRVAAGGSPITPEIYGRWVYEIPAWFWIIAQVSLGAATAWAIAARWRKTGGVLSLIMSGYFGLFTVLAVRAGAEGTILVAGALFHGSVPSFVCAMICFGRMDDE